MRTTLNVDADVLAASKSLAKDQGKSLGKVLSELARKALISKNSRPPKKTKNGVPLFDFPRKGRKRVVTLAKVNHLREELE